MVLVVSVIANFAMPWLSWRRQWGFRGDERFDLAVVYGRICFPYILFISLTALLSGAFERGRALHGRGRGAGPMNFILIVAMLMADRFGWDMGWPWRGPRRFRGSRSFSASGGRPSAWVCAAHPPAAPVARHEAAWPSRRPGAGGGVVQVNLLVGRQVGSFFDGAIAG